MRTHEIVIERRAIHVETFIVEAEDLDGRDPRTMTANEIRMFLTDNAIEPDYKGYEVADKTPESVYVDGRKV